jgi:hypothetical protein
LLALLALLAGSIAVWYFYEYLPLVLLVLLPFSVEIPISETTRVTLPTEVMIPGLFLLYLLITVCKGKFVYRASPLNIAVALIYLVMAGSYLITEEPVSTMKALIRDTGYIITGYYFIPMYVNSESRLKHVVFGGLVFHTLLVIYGFGTQAVMGFHIYGDVGYPFFVEHCVYAAFITVTFAFLFAYMLDYGKDMAEHPGYAALVFIPVPQPALFRQLNPGDPDLGLSRWGDISHHQDRLPLAQPGRYHHRPELRR